MVTAAEGNAALALMLTVISNLVGVLTTPYWLKAYFAGQNVSIDAVALLINLLLTGECRTVWRHMCAHEYCER
jgi:solute carrier family 10 (sodium/bile acid cotransporter), member 7